MLDVIHSWILAISGVLYQPWFVPVFLIVGGLYFTFRCKFIQVRLFKESFKVITEKPKSENGISSFGALMVSTASRVGTGNIIGVATAICLGGPGAIFWMWLTAFIGGATAFIESTLAQIYKKRDKDGSSYGGPAFYMQTALKQRWLGVIFSFLIIMIYAVGYNMLAAYNLQSTFAAFSFYDAGVTPKLTDPGDPLRRYRNRRSQETRSCHCRYGSGDGRYLRAGITADHGTQYHKHPAHVCNDFQERIRFPFYLRRIRRLLHYVGYQKRSVLQRGWYGFCSECCRKSRCFSPGKTGAGADAFCIYRYAFDLFSNGIHVPEH